MPLVSIFCKIKQVIHLALLMEMLFLRVQTTILIIEHNENKF